MLHRIMTPRIDVTCSRKSAATSSGVIVGDMAGEKAGNMKKAKRNSTAATGVVHNRVS